MDNNIPQINSNFTITIAIPDCFVSGILKLANGKNGHGERRLYTGDNNHNNNYICKKPWKINYGDDYGDVYKEMIQPILDNNNNFAKPCDIRKELVYKQIDECQDQLIDVLPQNGNEDVRRYYIGPNKSSKNNVKLYDKFRETLIPKQFSLELIETDEYFICNIVKNDTIEKKKKSKKSSNASIEYLNYISKINCIEIQHENNKGEFQLRNPANGYFWPVDGYHNCSIHECQGTTESPCKYNNHIWEFQGDYFHGNPNKYSDIDSFHGTNYSKKHEKDKLKKQFYQENGYIVNIKWESEWVEEKKQMKKNNIKWTLE